MAANNEPKPPGLIGGKPRGKQKETNDGSD